MKKLLLWTLAFMSYSVFTKENAALECIISDGNGYLVTESDNNVTLLSIESGQVVNQKRLDKNELELTVASKLTNDDKDLLEYVGVNVKKVAYVKSIKISEGEPSVILINAFDKQDLNLGGGIFVPAGFPIRCVQK